MDRAARYTSMADAVTGIENRWEPTTWIMSPARMYSFAFKTLAEKFSRGTFESKAMDGITAGTLTG